MSFVSRFTAVVVSLACGSVLSTVAPPAAVAAPPTQCRAMNRPGDGLPVMRVPVTPAGGPACTIRTTSFAATGQAVYVRGKALFNDGQRSLSKGNRNYVTSALHCYNAAGVSKFGIGAITNIWQGIGNTGQYPRGLFLPPSTGTWTCALEAANHPLVGAALDYYVTESYLHASNVNGGVSTPGPQTGDTWPRSLYVKPGTTYANGTKFEVRRLFAATPRSSSSVSAVATTNLTTCSFNSDVSGGGCPRTSPSIPNGLVAHVTLHLWIWQTASDSSTTPCPQSTAQHAVWSGNIDSIMHHYTVAQNLTFSSPSPQCGRSYVFKTEIENADGGPHVHIEGGSTALAAYS